MNEHDDDGLTQLYRDVAREKSPGHVDTRVLEAAARHAHVQRVHRRLRTLAIAAAVGALAIAIPRWITHESGRTPGERVDPARNAVLVQAVMALKAPEISGSAVTRCLLRNDLCAGEATSHR